MALNVSAFHERLQKNANHILMVLIALAALLGLAAIILFPPGKAQGGTDNWWPIVLNVAHGEGYKACQRDYFPFCEHALQESASREPLPILLYALIAKMTRDSLIATAFFNLFMFIGVLIGIYAIGNFLNGPMTAAVAGLAWVLYIPGYRSIPQVAGDLLATLLFTWAIYLFLRALKTQNLRFWILAGVFLGMSAMSRSVLLFVSAALLGCLLLYNIAYRRNAVKEPLVAIAVMLLCLAPWAIRNYTVFGTPLLGTTLSGYNLYRHNGLIEGDSWLHYASPKDAEVLVQKLLRTVPTRGNENEYEMNQIFTKEAMRIIRAHPDRYITLSLYRFLPLWFDIGINEAYNQSPTFFDRSSSLVQLIVLILSIIGIVLAWRHTWPLYVSILVVNIMHMAVNSRIRFLIVVIPLLLVYAAIALVHFITYLLSSRKQTGDSSTIDTPVI